MDIKITKFDFFRHVRLIVSLALLSFSCGEDDTLYLSKEFNFPVTITPARENFKIGDTLKIEVLIPKIMADRENSVQYLFENFDFDPFLSIRELGDKSKFLTNQPGANDKVKILNGEGEILPFSEAGNKLILNYTGSEYKLSGKLVLLNEGVFNLLFSTGEIKGKAAIINPPPGFKKIISGVGPSYFLVNSGIDINQFLINEYTNTKLGLPDSIDWARPFFSFRVVR
ncbi:hypothetical protein [Algoriphagus sp. AK58]|jgi:hypothetical protein|uniref:hypothetical protein n=1 Tax=Algoriphagus sp. AK58 TaxID=1406877 RepID=UPI0016503F3C|nr:hypothetical protein [Algoriphagus sp. AK58]MBC6368170.1 hypothetical protein [Algoriphagus sp. AK58]